MNDDIAWRNFARRLAAHAVNARETWKHGDAKLKLAKIREVQLIQPKWRFSNDDQRFQRDIKKKDSYWKLRDPLVEHAREYPLKFSRQENYLEFLWGHPEEKWNKKVVPTRTPTHMMIMTAELSQISHFKDFTG